MARQLQNLGSSSGSLIPPRKSELQHAPVLFISYVLMYMCSSFFLGKVTALGVLCCFALLFV